MPDPFALGEVACGRPQRDQLGSAPAKQTKASRSGPTRRIKRIAWVSRLAHQRKAARR